MPSYRAMLDREGCETPTDVSLLGRLLRERSKSEDISTDKPGVPIGQVVDLLRLAPLSLKEEGTSRAHYRKQLSNLANVVAASLTTD